MTNAVPGALIGRDEQLAHLQDLQKRLRHEGTGYVWVTGDEGCGKSLFLKTCAERAKRSGWEVLQGQCTEETRTDPYGPFLSMLGLCFDKAGRLINDRSVYSIVDQISIDDVFNAVTDIPGMAVVAFGIKVGMSIFEARRSPRAQDELLNRNFEFILQVLRQIDNKRSKPVFLVLDDLHMASTTTYGLLEYVFTRIQDTRLLVAASWQAESAERGLRRTRLACPKLAQPDHVLHLPPLPNEQMRSLLDQLGPHPVSSAFVSTLIEFSRGVPGRLVESLRLVELEDGSHLGARDLDASDTLVQTLIARQLEQLSSGERALLECAALIGQRVPWNVITASPLFAYLGVSERAVLSMICKLADSGTLLAWDGERIVRFTSPVVHRVLLDQIRQPVARRDHVRIAESWLSAEGESRPAQLAKHYLAGGDAERALEFAVQSAKELVRSAAYPEAVQSYRLALEALARVPEPRMSQYELLRAMSLAAEQAGDWEESIARLQDALALSEGDVARQAEIYAGLGWLCFQRGEIHAALEKLERGGELYASLADVQGQAQVDYYLGVVYSRQKEWQRAIACFERYLRVSQESRFKEGRASAYTELGNLHRLQRHWSQAEDLLRRGIALAEAEGDFVVVAQGYNYLGSCFALQGKAEAIDILHRALDIVSTRTKQPAQESRIQNTLAETLVRLNRWSEAKEAFHASAEIKERLGDRAGLAMTYGGLGRLYLRQWCFDQAVEYLQKDVDLLAEEFDVNVAWIQQWTNQIGEARRKQGRLDLAAHHFADALSLVDRIPDQGVREQSRAFTHMLFARLALDRNDLSTAESECAVALDVLAGTWAEAEIQRTVARLARARGDLTSARQHLDRALAAAERGEDVDRGLAYLEQARFYADSGDTVQVQKWAGQVVDIARRLQNAELERQASRLIEPM